MTRIVKKSTFINNADVFVSTGVDVLAANMFAYCKNNPVMLTDPSGREAYIVDYIDNYRERTGRSLDGAATGGAGLIVVLFVFMVMPNLNNTVFFAPNINITCPYLPKDKAPAETVCGTDITISYTVSDQMQNTLTISKGHQGNMKDSGLIGLTNEEIQEKLENPNITKKEKQRLVRQQKARGYRNKQKRKGYLHSE